MNKKTVWNFWAGRYEKLWVQKYSLGPTRREITKYLEKILQKEKKYKILDVGCGIGQLLRDIKESFFGYDIELVGVDFSQEMIRRATALDDTIRYQQMDIEDMSGIGEKFDIILCTHSFPYYPDQEKAIRDFRGLLKEDGYLLMAQASQNNFYDQAAMFFVKLTTGKAHYPSVREMLDITKHLFFCGEIIRIKERAYMPSIYFFVFKGDGK
ncbi:MAG: class I SAM-dependent methyltransferase [Bacillota bacterium]